MEQATRPVPVRPHLEPTIEVEPKTWHIRYYHTDHIGTPRELTSEDGEVLWSVLYQAWGNTLRETWLPEKIAKAVPLRDRENQIKAQNLTQHLRFQGQYFDEETGLHYNRGRYYDPDCGRFISQDPIKMLGGSNLFLYAPNPTVWIDPLGLDTTSDAKILSDNLTKCGASRPSSNHHAHHIVMSNSQDPKMVALRDKMNALDLDINDSSNGIWLPNNGASRLPAESSTAHHGEGVHGKDYKTKIYNRLINSKTQEEFLEGLNKIKSQFKNGITFCCCRKRR